MDTAHFQYIRRYRPPSVEYQFMVAGSHRLGGSHPLPGAAQWPGAPLRAPQFGPRKACASGFTSRPLETVPVR